MRRNTGCPLPPAVSGAVQSVRAHRQWRMAGSKLSWSVWVKPNGGSFMIANLAPVSFLVLRYALACRRPVQQVARWSTARTSLFLGEMSANDRCGDIPSDDVG